MTDDDQNAKGAARDHSPSSDPFAHLHKMSTTAGLGSGDYVAINAAAVASILLGLASSLVLFNTWILLIFPIVGIVCAIFAIRQISRSNGTQTGREVAALGLLLSLGFGGYATGKSIYKTLHDRSDQQQVIAVIHQFGELLKSHDYHSAYNLFDSRLQGKVPYTQFESVMSHLTDSPFGKLEYMDWNERLELEVNPVTQNTTASGMIKMIYPKLPANAPVRFAAEFQNADGKWLIDQLPQLFNEDPAPAPGPRRGMLPNPAPQKTAPLPLGPLGPPKPH